MHERQAGGVVLTGSTLVDRADFKLNRHRPKSSGFHACTTTVRNFFRTGACNNTVCRCVRQGGSQVVFGLLNLGSRGVAGGSTRESDRTYRLIRTSINCSIHPTLGAKDNRALTVDVLNSNVSLGEHAGSPLLVGATVCSKPGRAFCLSLIICAP